MSAHARTLVAILHTHWDVEWYLGRGALTPRLVRAIDEVLDLLEHDPRVACFHLDGQTILVEDYLAIRPDQRARLAGLVASGRLAIGPWYVLADELLSSAVALIRNLAIGTSDSLALGRRLDVGYSPDTFGHPAALPSVLEGFGLETAVLWRGVPDDVTSDRFRWRAPDGAAVRVWHLPPEGYESGKPTAAVAARARGAVTPVFVGGDHHTPEPDVADRLRDLSFARLDEALGALDGDTLPAVDGELRAAGRQWVLQGTHSARIPLKRAIWQAGRWLERWAEPHAALAPRPAGSAEQSGALLAAAWRLHLRSHFHDTLCGTVADDVARDAMVREATVEAIAREVVREGWDRSIGHDPVEARRAARAAWRPALALWNPAPRPRGGVVIADVTTFVRDVLVGAQIGKGRRELGGRPIRWGEEGSGKREGRRERAVTVVLEDQNGIRRPVQVLDTRRAVERLESPRDYPDQDEVDVIRVAFEAPDVPGFGFCVLRLTEDDVAPPSTSLAVSGRHLENEFVGVTIEDDGTATLIDRRSGERFEKVMGIDDTPDGGDLYTFCPKASKPPGGKGEEGRGKGKRAQTHVVARGPLVGAIEVRAGEFRFMWTLHHDSPIARVTIRHDHRGHDHRIRALVPTTLRHATAVAGMHFGPVARPPVRSTGPAASGEWPVSTAPCHRVVSVARGRRGISVFTDALQEYELTDDGTIAVTLLRAVGELSKGDLWTRPGHAAWATPTPDAQCVGPQSWSLGLLLHDAATLERYRPVADAADDFDTPVAGRMIRNALALSPKPIGITLEGEGMVFLALHPSRVEPEAIVLRCYNATDATATAAWRFAVPVSAAYRVRLDDDRAWPVTPDAGGRLIRFGAGPREIVTVRVQIADCRLQIAE